MLGVKVRRLHSRLLADLTGKPLRLAGSASSLSKKPSRHARQRATERLGMGHLGISWMFVRWRQKKWGNGQTVHRLSETTLTTEEVFALEARGGVYTVTKGFVKDENCFAQNCCPSTYCRMQKFN